MARITANMWSKDLDLGSYTVQELEKVRVFAAQWSEDAQNFLAAIDLELERRYESEPKKE
jgi:hypothetical protein